MSKFTVFTLFPEQIENALSHSIMKRAMEDEKLSLNCVNIRDFTEDPHGHVDDAPFGGGAGMLMQVQPIVSAFEDLVKREGRPDRVIYCSPRGKVFKQSMAGQRGAYSLSLRALRRHRPKSLGYSGGRGGFHRRLCAYRRRTSGSDYD